MTAQLFEYKNTWSTPRLGFFTEFLYPDIGHYVSAHSLVSGLSLDEFSEEKTFLRSLGSFKVTGEYSDVRLFAQSLEKDYKDYISFFCDWDQTDSIFN
ncbi:hypothetical protein b3_0207 [Synechococcus phage B3]|nr:hypothetical protein b3_0207 [Synechococcus phage B3]QGT54820.1 hypothetical protein b23_0205 [Synechococcus phage B23]